MLKNNGNIHVYNPGVGADNTEGLFYLELAICCNRPGSGEVFLKVFTIIWAWRSSWS